MSFVRVVVLQLVMVATRSAAWGAPPGASGERQATLEELRSAAMEHSPLVRAAEAEAAEARGRLVAARTYPYNPEIAVELAERDTDDDTDTDRSLSLSQQIELAGQRGKRVAAGEASLTAAERRLVRRRQEVLAEVERSFAAALGARDLIEVAEGDLALTRNLLDFEERRLAAGATTQIEVNLARAATGRSERRLQETRAEWMAARSHLAEAAGLDPAAPPIPVGQLEAQPAAIADLENLVAAALAQRADLASRAQEGERARQQLRLERSVRVPDLRVAAFSNREEDDDITGIGVGLLIPLFNRNQGTIAEASSAVERSDAETRAQELRVRQEVTEARARLESAGTTLAALSALVVDTLAESLDLLQRAMEAGKVSATDVLVLRRELVEGRREYVEAAVGARLARIDLELATGATPLPGAP